MKRFASFQLCLWLPFVTLAYEPCPLCIHRATPSTLEAMELRLYTGPTLEDYTSVRIGRALELLGALDTSRPTVFYINGWRGSPDNPNVQAVTSAYLARGDHNVVVLDWRKIAGQFPIYTLSSIDGVGFTLAKALDELVAHGLTTEGLHLVGHSFGAQVCGYTGRYVGFRVPRITGLDPAGMGFYGVSERLSSRDAEFVVVINTDVYLYGLNVHLAHADFYPNGGFRPQPGCPAGVPFTVNYEDLCSHNRAVYFYADSVLYEEAFPSLKCDSYSKFHSGICLANEKVVMGFATPTTARGKFYLRTDDVPVFDQRNNNGLIENP